MRAVIGCLAGLSVAGLAGAAQAQAGPSFDCSAAATAVEETVCGFADLAWLDQSVAGLYRALAEGLDAERRSGLRAEQRAWLRERDRCNDRGEAGGSLYACTYAAYADRLSSLAAALEANPSGVYDYAAEGDSSGVLLLAVLPGDTTGATAGAVISTVTGRTAHLCDVAFSDVPFADGRLAWRSSEDIYGDGQLCTVSLGVDGDVVTIASENCSGYCGHNAWFDGDYVRR